jgi:hypothetical protein
MERSLILRLSLVLTAFVGVQNAPADDVAIARGKAIFATYCAPCHGVAGAGLVGPNLTDSEVLYGESLPEIITVITQGVPARAMPSWASVLTAAEVSDTAQFVKSIMGLNLVGPARGGESTVTPFPEGSLNWPFVLRTFMPALELPDGVFAHHGHGRDTFKYQPTNGTFDQETIQSPIDGVPGAIAVNFGPTLSYCFDTTECRLLYIWTGPFVDMTYYWGEGSGGARKSFDYLARVIGDVKFKASGAASFPGQPRFKGYRKVHGVPEMSYTLGDTAFTLRIEPSEDGRTALLHYTTTGLADGLTMTFDSEEGSQIVAESGPLTDHPLVLTGAEAQSFTLQINL